MGTTHTITWDDNISENVEIWWQKEDDYGWITTSTDSDGDYDWEIPEGMTPDDDYIILVGSTFDGDIYGYSDDYFEISNADFITVTSPNGGTCYFNIR